MKVNVHNQTDIDIKEWVKQLKKIFRPIKEKKQMEIIIVSNEDIQTLNYQYRNINEPTDVLSFVNDNEKTPSLGDVFISLEQAYQQAKNYGHSMAREIGFLAVHGYLHLLGYDHDTSENEKAMRERQEVILAKAKLKRS
ncbi:MAG: rRNA maturation RNase YbeY [Acholeplasmataceae bacterium]|nr:rRNA maturation RNase YbeY [Acholeplasmataceae bacterium]